ncbi:hypothetical protein L218DRAFT_952907 [Marasmius fiardii PR-910]|nr:hypothetical protein L218DRAFT_952907 [Marasmius fiardii PR-910]
MVVEKKTCFYAVKYGRTTGVFMCWEDCKAQVKGYVGARYKKFHVRQNADAYVRAVVEAKRRVQPNHDSSDSSTSSASEGNTRNEDVANDSEDDFFADAHPLTPPRAGIASSSVKVEGRVQIESSSTSALRGSTQIQDVATDVEDDYFADARPLAPRNLAAIPGKGKEPATNEDQVPERYEDLVVYCDGACKNNGTGKSTAGIGVWWGDNDKRNLCERCPGTQTNNCAELVAIVRALEQASIDVKRRLVIMTDSTYAKDCLTVWIKKWIKIGTSLYKKDGDTPVANAGLILYACALIECREKLGQSVKIEHVKGHAGTKGNEAADRLANLGANRGEKEPSDCDWTAKEKKYREDVEQMIASGEIYLRREGGVKVDIIGTSQEERELGGFQVKMHRPTSAGSVTGHPPQTYGDEEESTSSQFISRPAGPPLQYRSDQSTQSDSPPISPKRSFPAEEMKTPSLGEDVMTLLRRKRAHKLDTTPGRHRSAQKGVAYTQGEPSDIQGSDLEAYAQCLADSDDLGADLSG